MPSTYSYVTVRNHELTAYLVNEKTVAVLITNRRKSNSVKVWIGNHEVISKSIIMVDIWG